MEAMPDEELVAVTSLMDTLLGKRERQGAASSFQRVWERTQQAFISPRDHNRL